MFFLFNFVAISFFLLSVTFQYYHHVHVLQILILFSKVFCPFGIMIIFLLFVRLRVGPARIQKVHRSGPARLSPLVPGLGGGAGARDPGEGRLGSATGDLDEESNAAAAANRDTFP